MDIYAPSADEKAQWVEQCGYNRPEWRPFKKDILGSENVFERLLEASVINNGYTFDGV